MSLTEDGLGYILDIAETTKGGIPDETRPGSLALMPPCFATGQAAGTAGALALETSVSPRHVHVPLLRQVLNDQGALI